MDQARHAPLNFLGPSGSIGAARRFRATLATVALVAAVLGCGNEAPMPATEPPVPVPVADPTASAPASTGDLVPAPAEEVPPPPPPTPSPGEVAAAAVAARDYAAVCSYLVGAGFSEDVCRFIVAKARDDGSASLTTTTYERFLRGHHVHRLNGSVIGLLDAANNTYEVRVGGRHAILDATDTTFETTGRFSMWVQDQPTEEVGTTGGGTTSAAVYREWPLYEHIIDLARTRGTDAPQAAHALLEELVALWEPIYRWVDPNAAPDGVTAPTSDDAIAALRDLIPATGGPEVLAAAAPTVATYLETNALRYAELSEFPRTRLSALRTDPEQRGMGWRMSGTVIQVRSDDTPPMLIIVQSRAFTCAIVPDVAARHRYDRVSFAGVALQPGTFRDIGGNTHDCVVAVGYLR